MYGIPSTIDKPFLPKAIGGTIADYDIYRKHTFSYTGSVAQFEVLRPGYFDFLILAGGGGGGPRDGGTTQPSAGAGGGAGGLIYRTDYKLMAGKYNLYVGAGAVAIDNGNSENGQDSYFTWQLPPRIGITLFTAIGGGSAILRTGVRRGGCGGGAGLVTFSSVGYGTSGQGFRGGYKDIGGNVPGGGGCGEPGYISTNSNGGRGGDGISRDISGASVTYGGGGGGGAVSTAYVGGAGGAGGGGKGQDASASVQGTDGLGGGGGGALAGTSGTYLAGKDGGNGIIIIRYRHI